MLLRLFGLSDLQVRDTDVLVRAPMSGVQRERLPVRGERFVHDFLSTPRGVMSDIEARAANVGGEVLCRVF